MEDEEEIRLKPPKPVLEFVHDGVTYQVYKQRPIRAFGLTINEPITETLDDIDRLIWENWDGYVTFLEENL